jgi:hypothetical protein
VNIFLRFPGVSTALEDSSDVFGIAKHQSCQVFSTSSVTCHYSIQLFFAEGPSFLSGGKSFLFHLTIFLLL